MPQTKQEKRKTARRLYEQALGRWRNVGQGIGHLQADSKIKNLERMIVSVVAKH